MNLGELMKKSDPGDEPSPDQVVVLDGETQVQMLACLDRTAVVLLDGKRVLVRHGRIGVDPDELRWQRRTEVSAKQAYVRMKQRMKSK